MTDQNTNTTAAPQTAQAWRDMPLDELREVAVFNGIDTTGGNRKRTVDSLRGEAVAAVRAQATPQTTRRAWFFGAALPTFRVNADRIADGVERLFGAIGSIFLAFVVTFYTRIGLPVSIFLLWTAEVASSWAGLAVFDSQMAATLETRGGVVIPTPTEEDYFHALRLPYMPPHERTAENLRIVLRAERSRKVPA